MIEPVYVPPYPFPFPWCWCRNYRCKHSFYEDQAEREGLAFVRLGFCDRRDGQRIVCTCLEGPANCPFKQGWERRAEEFEVLFVMQQAMLPEDIPGIPEMSFSLGFSTFSPNLTGFLEEVK